MVWMMIILWVHFVVETVPSAMKEDQPGTIGRRHTKSPNGYMLQFAPVVSYTPATHFETKKWSRKTAKQWVGP